MLGKTWVRLRSRGARETFGDLARRVAGAIRSDGELVFLSRPAAGEVGSDAGTDLVRATPSHGPAYARDIGTDSAASFTARLEPSQRCYLLLEGGRVVHATWAATQPAWVGELRAWFVPPRAGGYVYESFTRPEARGRGLYPSALRRICADLAAEGIEEVWVGVEAGNHASLRAVSKAGFALAFTIPFRRRLGHVSLDPPSGSRAEEAAERLTPQMAPRKR